MGMTVISPKLEELMKWDKIEEVNKKLDNGESPTKVANWANKNGLKISHPIMYKYKDLRKKAIIEGLQMQKFVNPFTDVFKETKKTKLTNTKTYEKVKNELEIIDEIIQRGYRFLMANKNFSVSPSLVMRAIDLKNKLTEGSHKFLTNYGIEYLKTLEQGKFEAVLKTLLEFVPEDKRDEALSEIERVEDEYYRNTEYYEEYLEAKKNIVIEGEYSVID